MNKEIEEKLDYLINEIKSLDEIQESNQYFNDFSKNSNAIQLIDKLNVLKKSDICQYNQFKAELVKNETMSYFYSIYDDTISFYQDILDYLNYLINK